MVLCSYRGLNSGPSCHKRDMLTNYIIRAFLSKLSYYKKCLIVFKLFYENTYCLAEKGNKG